MISTVLITCPATDAQRLSDHLLKGRHCACVNMLPGVKSRYWWQGKIESAEEVLLLVKCPDSGVQDLITQVRSVHPYEVPEIIALPVSGGNPDYLQWVIDECKKVEENNEL
jgi:periplasmic divalent cation tolerance protein